MRLCKLALVLGAAALLASPALAQRGGFNMAAFSRTAGFLVQNKSVQDELKIDTDQKDKIREATQKVFEDFRDEFAKIPTAKPEERDEILKKLNEATEKAVKGALKEEQIKRLTQIQVQQKGVDLFSEEKVAKDLKLSDEQKEKIKDIQKDLKKETDPLQPQRGGGKPDLAKIQENRKKIQSLEKEAMANATKTLNADQKKQLKEMQGEPFELKLDFGGFKPGGGKPEKPRTDF
jgi:Spy/CpxP family protein refolding chaperone